MCAEAVRPLTEVDAHITLMAPMLLVTVTRTALARSSGLASALRSGLTMRPKLQG